MLCRKGIYFFSIQKNIHIKYVKCVFVWGIVLRYLGVHMIRKNIFLTLMFFLSASIIATLFFGRKMNVKKEGNSEQAVMKAAAVEQVHREVKERDIHKATVTEEPAEENDKEEQKTYTNIETSNDYVNFERLIMQISEYTTPDEIGDEEE